MSIDAKRQPVITYRVYYEANPDYKGDWNVPSKPGFQGPFEHFDKAKEAMDACQRWFNEEAQVAESTDRDGKVTRTVTKIIHDNVDVEIKTFVDGFPAKEGFIAEEEPEKCEETKANLIELKKKKPASST